MSGRPAAEASLLSAAQLRDLSTTVKMEGARQTHFQHLPIKSLAHFL
jgi:hypothetical protein